MRNYANLNNLKRAALLGTAIAIMSIPRFIDAGLSLATFLPAAFLAMTLVSAAGTAWGNKFGLKGLFPNKLLIQRGLIVAVALGLIALPIKIYITDPILNTCLPPSMIRLSFPTTLTGIAGIILWSAGFENMFFNVAATSYFTRLSRNKWLAVAMSAAFRTFVSSRIMMAAGIDSPPLLMINALSCLIAGSIFAEFGLPASALFTAISASSIAFH